MIGTRVASRPRLGLRQTGMIAGIFFLPLIAGPAAEPQAPEARLLVRDAAYGPGGPAASDPGRTLDLYGPAQKPDTPRPIVLFVHGGGWRHGDKRMVGEKPSAFVAGGCLFASAGYRLDAAVSPREQAADIAAAVRWLHDHASEHGGDPGKIVLMGHSAGAHLVALVSTDERLLKACDLDRSAVRGVVLLDGAGYDVPRQVAAARLPMLKDLYRKAFGDDPTAQREASPIEYVKPGGQYPPVLAFHVGRRQDSREQAESLAARVREAGGRATTVHEPDKNHLTLNRELGLPGDGPTGRIFEFLDDVLAER